MFTYTAQTGGHSQGKHLMQKHEDLNVEGQNPCKSQARQYTPAVPVVGWDGV